MPFTLHHITKTFPGGVRAVEDLTLDAAEGELLVLMGPSGCGKTTTLRIIAGLERPTHGSVTIAGRSMDGVRPKDRDVAMVFQHGALYPHLSLLENMAFGLRLRRTGRAEIEQRVREAADMLGLAAMLDRMPGELSGGQRQRVALGRAMVRRPRLFLFDEPLADLDVTLRAQMRQEIRQLHARLGTTMLYVTHDQTEAMTLGQRIAVLREGRLQQVADPMTLYERPANRFVAGLIGTPALCFIEGRIERRGETLVFASGEEWPIPAARQAALGAYAGRAVLLGARAEHIRTAENGSPGGPRAQATIEAVERLGPESFLYLKTTAGPLVARIEGNGSPAVGTMISVTLDMERAHFFDPQTGAALERYCREAGSGAGCSSASTIAT